MLLSRMIITMFLKDSSTLALYIIDNTRPVVICKVKVIPNMKPKFQRVEIDLGLGRSSREFFTIFKIGFFFVS
jgi:hypothetical protein